MTPMEALEELESHNHGYQDQKWLEASAILHAHILEADLLRQRIQILESREGEV